MRQPGFLRALAACAVAVVLCTTAEAGTLSAVVPSGASAGAVLQITGTGLNAIAARNEIHFLANGTVVTAIALSVTTVDATRRMVTVRVPAGLPIGTTPLRVVNLDTSELSEGRSVEIVAISLGAVAAAYRGQANVLVEIQGTPNARFISANTRVAFGAGITTSSLTVHSNTRLTVALSVAAAAALGPRTVSVLTTTQTLLLTDGFTVADQPPPPPPNTAPIVDAGPDQSMTRPASVVTLAGTATDDGRPAGNPFTIQWSRVSGPGPVVFASPAAAATTATLSLPGQYELRLSATDGELTTQDTVVVTVNPAPNTAPTVDAGAARSISLPTNTVSLEGSVTDDGYPEGSLLTVAWTQLTGPPGVTFAAASNAATTATFPGTGVYSLRLSANDGELGAAAEVTVTVNPAPITNAAPVVTAVAKPGAITLPVDSVELSGNASDDGLPAGSTVTFKWQRIDGPLGVAFAAESSRNTSALFSEAGTFVLRLTASDGQRSGSADVKVVVAPTPPPAPPEPPPPNAAPEVTARAEPAAVTLPSAAASLSGTATDDGLPGNTVVVTWSKVSGPGEVSFGSANAITTTATFSAAGSYVLKLEASDGALTASAEVTVTVNPAPPPPPPVNVPPSVTAGATPSSITLPVSTVNLLGGASDDGRPNGLLSYRWTTVSGPAAVQFDVASEPQTAARFTTAGTYVVRLTASDGQDAGAASVTVVVNPGAPPPPVNRAPQARPGGPYNGDAATPIAFSGKASSDPDGDALTYAWDFGDGQKETGPAPIHTYATAGSYTVALTVTDAHGSASAAATTATVGPAADRAPPNVTLNAPATALPGDEVRVTAAVSDNVGVAGVTFTVNGATPSEHTAPPFERAVAIPSVAAPGTTFTVRASARDTSNNIGAGQAVITVVAAPDTVAPLVTLSGPATATPGQTVVLTASASDNVGVSSVRFLRGAANVATVAQPPFTTNSSIPAGAAVGSVVIFTARASDFTGNVADASVAVSIVAAPDSTPPAVSIAAPSQVGEGAQFEVTATATDNAGVASVTFSIDDVPVATSTVSPYRATIAVPSTRIAGSVLRLRAVAADGAGLTAAATATTFVVGVGTAAGLVAGEVFDDATGLPLAGARVTLVGQSQAPKLTDIRGRYVLPGDGLVRIRIDKTGYSSAERWVTVSAGAVIEALDARLTPLAAEATADPALDVEVGNDDVRLRLPAGSVAARVALRATRIGAQGLRGLLPAGWSPIAAVDLSPGGIPLAGAAVTARNLAGVGAGALLGVAVWDDENGAWRFAATATVSASEPLAAQVGETTQVVWLLPDTEPASPPPQVPDTALTGVIGSALPPAAAATITPDPKIAVYSPGFRALVGATLNVDSLLSSGIVVRARLSERYDFVDRPRVLPEPTSQDFVFYQFPGGTTRLQAFFTVSPSVGFDAAALAEGVITVELRSRSDGGLSAVGPDGGRVALQTGESFTLPPGALAGAAAVGLERIDLAALALDLPPALTAVGAVAVTLGDVALSESGALAIPRPAGLVDETGLILAKLEDIGGATRLRLVAVGRIAGEQIVSDVAVVGLATPLPGVRTSGRYVFLRIAAPFGYVTGIVRGVSNDIAPGTLVTTSTLPLAAVSGADGQYVTVALAAANEVTALDMLGMATLDAAVSSVAVPAGGIARLDLRLVALAPRVTSVSPGAGAADVALGAPVAVSFSEPIDPATVDGLVVEVDGQGPLTGTRTLSDGSRVLTFRSQDGFAANTLHRVRVRSLVRDPGGRALEPEFTSTFTTIDTSPRPAPAAGAVSATVPTGGRTTIRATQGTAGVRDTVRVHNLSRKTFQIALVAPDGSFEATLDAHTTDRIRIGIVTPAGVETTIDLVRFSQQNADGSITSTVDAEGGLLEGPNGVQVQVPQGAFPGGTAVTIDTVDEPSFPIALTTAQRTQFSFTGGVRLDFGGAQPAHYLNVSIPAQGGEAPDDRWVLAGVMEFGGRQVLAAVDTARLIDGRIQTSSPPCPGVLAAQTYGFYRSVKPVGVVYGKFPNPNPWAGAANDAVSQQLLMMVTPFLGPELAGAIPYGVSDDFPSLSRNICLPALSGRVTVTPNTQDVIIRGSDLTPGDREVVVRNTQTGQRFVYPREVVEFRAEIDGSLTDTYQVRAVTPGGEAAVGFELKSGAPGRTVVRVDMHAIAAAVNAIVIRNLAKPGIEVTVPVQQLDVRAAVSGGATSTEYAVQVVNSQDESRDVPFTVESPFGPGRLVARAIPLTIDPGTRTFIRNLTRGTEIEVPESLVVLGRGGFDLAFDGDPDDRYAIEVRYLDISRLPLIFAVPKIKVYSVNPVTGARRVVGEIAMPPQDEPFNLGAVGGDTTRPFLVGTPDNLTSFDPASFLTFRFSEGVDRQTALTQVKLLDGSGREVEIEIRLSDGNRVLTIVPRAPLELGQTYSVRLADQSGGSGLTDGSGNLVTTPTIHVKTFQPRRIGPTFLTGQPYPPTHLELWQSRDATPRRKILALQGKLGDGVTDPVVTVFDLSDADNPQTLYKDTGGLRFFEVEDWAVATGLANLPLSGPSPCTGQPTFTGDLAVMTRFSQSSVQFGFSAGALDIFDVTNPAAPCRFGVKILTGTNLDRSDVFETVGYPKAVELMPIENGLLAFTAVQNVGLTVVDVTKVIGGVTPEQPPLVPGNYRDVAIAGSVVLALEQSTATIDVFNPQLARLASFPLTGEVEAVKMAYVSGFHIDLNEDGVVDQNELRNLAFVGGARGLWVADVTDIRNIELRAFVPTAAPVHRVSIDRDGRRAVASTANRRFFLADFSTLASFTGGPLDQNGNGVDDRITWQSPEGLYTAGGGRLLAFDEARGLVYVSNGFSGIGINPVGVDSWALNSLCCDLRVDMVREADLESVQGPPELIDLERQAIQQGIQKGLVAAQSCGVPIASTGQPAGISILEQGSGSCIWKPNPQRACAGNYQPGLSDHDYEIFIPNQYFASGAALCVVDKLAEQFTDPATKAPKPILVKGRTFTFDDITFFPFRKDGFEAAQLDIFMPENKKGDTSGDLGMGRQQLLLLWLLGGEYIRVDGFNVQGTPLVEILQKLRTQTQIPRLEGYEWANLQKHNLFKTKAFVRIAGASNADSAFHALFIKQLHDAGKAGIRTVFARMVANADPALKDFILRIRRSQNDPGDAPAYDADACRLIESADTSSWTPKPCAGFEDFIASTAARTISAGFNLFTPEEIFEVVHKFWRIKGDVRLPTREEVRDDTSANEFIASVAGYIDATIEATRAAYEAEVPSRGDAAQRGSNLQVVFKKTLQNAKDVVIPAVPRVSNHGFRNAEGVPVVMYRGSGTSSGTRVKPKPGAEAILVPLAGGETLFLENADSLLPFDDDEADRNLSDQEKYQEDAKKDLFTLGDLEDRVTNPPLDQTAERGAVRWVAFTIDLDGSERTVKEHDRDNNYNGFFYYILNPASPQSPVPAEARVPLPIPAGPVLEPDPECDPPTEINITQFFLVDEIISGEPVEVPIGKPVRIEAVVRNISQNELDGVQVCHNIPGQCEGVGSLSPGEETRVPFEWVAQPAGYYSGVATASSADGGARSSAPTTVIVSCSAQQIVELSPNPNPASSSAMHGGVAVRYYRVIDVTTGRPVTQHPLVILDDTGVIDLAATTDDQGLVHTHIGGGQLMPGVRVPALPHLGVGTLLNVTLQSEDADEAACGAVTFPVVVKPRTFSSIAAGGSALKLSGKFHNLVELSAKGGYGVELTLESQVLADATADTQIGVTTQRAFGVEAALKGESKKLDVKLGAEAKGPEASVSYAKGFELATFEKYKLPAPLDGPGRLALSAIVLEPILEVARHRFQTTTPVLAAIADSFVGPDPFGKEPYEAALGGSVQVGHELTSKMKGFTFTFGKSDEVQTSKDFGLNIGSDVSMKGGVTAALEFPKGSPLSVVPSIEHRGEMNVKVGVELGLELLKDSPFIKKLTEHILKLNQFFRADISEIGGIKFEVPINLETLAPACPSSTPGAPSVGCVVVTLLEKKKFGLVFDGEKVVDQGDNYRRSAAYTIRLTSPEKEQQVVEQILIVSGLLSLAQNVPPAFAFTEDEIGKQIVSLIALADEYELSIESGRNFKYPVGFDSLVEKLTGSAKTPGGRGKFSGLELEVKLDGATKYVTERGVVLQGEAFALEAYTEQDPLIPTSGPQRIAGMLADTKAFYDAAAGRFKALKKNIEKGSGVSKTIADFFFSPSGVTLEVDGAAEPNDGEAFELDIVGFKYRGIPIVDAPPAQDPHSVAGRPDVPHNGIGGFFQFLPDGQQLAAPATITIRWLDEEVVGLDESSIRIYRWNGDRNDWDLVGGTPDPGNNQVVGTIDRLGLYTAAPFMPVGTVTLTTQAAGGGPANPVQVTATSSVIRLNAGQVVPDGTRFTLYTTTSAASGAIQVGTILTPDEDPQTPGHQVSTVGGVLSFAVEFPNALGEGRALAWPTNGGTAFLDHVLPLVQQP